MDSSTSIINSITLYLDNREHQLINLFNNVNKTNIIQSNLITKNLDIGDIIIEYHPSDNQINQTSKNRLILERKTIPDLISSIKDGRYHEQKIRLLSCQSSDTIIGYIIEGDINQTIQHNNTDLTKSQIYGMFISNIFRDKRSEEHTSELQSH